MTSKVRTVHIWGFYDRDGTLKLPAGCAVSEKTPFEVFCDVRSNLLAFEVEIVDLETSRQLSGSFVGCSFDSKVGKHDPSTMWHVITRPDDEWPAQPPVVEGGS